MVSRRLANLLLVVACLLLGAGHGTGSPPGEARWGRGASPCVSAIESSRPNREIFSASDRKGLLEAAGLDQEALGKIFDSHPEEHDMVKIAIDTVASAKNLSPIQKAAYWEELSTLIQRRIGKPVSQSYRGTHDGKEIYVFQGSKRFDGKAYVLVILQDGAVYTGKVDPIDQIANWCARLTELKPL